MHHAHPMTWATLPRTVGVDVAPTLWQVTVCRSDWRLYPFIYAAYALPAIHETMGNI